MKLNDSYDVVDYSREGAEFNATIKATMEQALALQGSDIALTTDEGETVELFSGYDIVAIAKDGDDVKVYFVRAVDEKTAEAIQALETNLAAVRDGVAKAQKTAEEALSAGAGVTEVGLFAAFALEQLAPEMADEDLALIPSLVPEWEVGVSYAAKQIVRHDGALYRIAQAHESQAQWVPGAPGTESLYTAIEVAGDGIDVWKQPTGAHDAYRKGDRVHYPGEGGPVYESLIDANTWSPEAYPAGWSKVE